MSEELAEMVLSEAEEKMRKTLEHTREEFAGVRTGRASSALVERISVEYYGQEVPLRQLASFSIPEARQLVINAYDTNALSAIEKAIRDSDLGLNPSSDGKVIRLNFPPLTEERRRELVKLVRQLAEEGRVALRNERRAARHDLEQMARDGELSKDAVQRYEKRLDEMIHRYEAEIDAALETKEQELLEG
ncbi:MAG: ribosome-recycling factor [Acidimicrobiales bacterium]|nr:MAG: ribosome-recycling factor [Acidimicrobiales bacterium]